MDFGLTLTNEMALVFGLVIFTVTMLVLEWIRPDLVALLVIVTIGITGLVPVDQLFDGFAGNAVISLIAVMIMGAGLDRTGVLSKAAAFILRMSGGAEARVSLLVNSLAGSMSAVIQSQALAALLLPVVSRVSSRTGIPLKRLMLPMACCVLAGASTTMIASSPLILLNDLIESSNRNLPPGARTIETLNLFSVTPIGIVLLLVALVFFAFATRWLLPGDSTRQSVTPGRTETYFEEMYGIDGDILELTVTAESPLVGMSVGETERLHSAPLILALKTGNESRLSPPADQMIWVGSVLGVLGKREDINEFANNHLCRVQTRLRNFGDMFNPTRAGIAEGVVPPNSRWIKKSVADIRLRKHFGISVLAINRGNEVLREDVRNIELNAGDALVMHGFWRDMAVASESRDMVIVTDFPKVEQRPSKIWFAVTFFGLALGLGLFTDIKLAVAMMTGAVGMLLAGVLTMDEAYNAINWKTIFILACLIPLGWGMDSTGAAAWVAQQLMHYMGDMPQWALQASLAILTLLFAQVISNVGAAVMMVPMAINIALASGGNPAAYALLVAISTSNTFLLSSGNPALLLVANAGGYRKADFFRVGLPLTVLILVATLVSVNVFIGSG